MVATERRQTRGKVVTFYSYKGGVGRSMALANVGALLAQWGFKTLLIDWDLEAPGLENYFSEFLSVQDIRQRSGLIELLLLRTNEEGPGSTAPIEWAEYVSPVNVNGNQNLFIITAGKRDDGYTEKVRKFDFKSFYGEYDGGQYLEDLREYWIGNYDFVLIDSRTGLTDSSGICSIHMPDILTLIFTPNEQSFNGIRDVARKAIAGQKKLVFDRFRLRTFPVPSRIENAETLLLDEWMKKIAGGSGDMLSWLPVMNSGTSQPLIEPIQLLDKIKIPYKTLYAYGEKLPSIQRGTSDPQDIGYVYETLAACFANDLEHIHQLKDSRDLYVKRAKGEEVTSSADLQAKLEEEKRKTEMAYQQKIEEETKRIQEESQIKQRSQKTSFWVWSGVAAVLTFIALFYMYSRTSAPDVTAVAEIQQREDSVAKKSAYLDFVAAYNKLNGLGTDEHHLELLHNYYALDAAYRDSTAEDIREQLEINLSGKFEQIMRSFYEHLRARKLRAADYFADTVVAFGTHTNLGIAEVGGILSKVQKANDPVTNTFDKFISFRSDSTGYVIAYDEVGNHLLDNGKEYATVKNLVTVRFNSKRKITSYTYETLSGVPPRIRIDLFICATRGNFQDRNRAVMDALKSFQNYSVNVRSLSSIDAMGGPNGVSANQLRYNGDAEFEEAKKIKKTIEAKVGVRLDLVKARTATRNYISIFLCETSMGDYGDGSMKGQFDKQKRYKK